MSFRPLPVMTVCVVAALIVLAMLGNWQWQRYHDKQSALAVDPDWQSLSGEVIDRGVFWVSTIYEGQSAWREMLAIDTGEGVVVATHGLTLGIDPPDRSPTAARTPDLERGIYRDPPDRNRFAPAPQPDRGIHHEVSIDAFEVQTGRRLLRTVFEPETLSLVDEAGTAQPVANPWANPALADPLPPSRHLGYALTWWGMGLGLIAIYLVYHVQSGRLSWGART